MKRKHVTLADVAALAGVSKTAASLILNDRPGSRLSENTAVRIRAAAEELGYRPNPAARTLRSGTTRTVGLISDDVIVTRYASAMIRGALDVAHHRDHTLLISETGKNQQHTKDALDALLDHRADGIVFALMGAKLVDLPPIPDHLRVVMLNGSSSAGHPSVLPSEFDAGYRIARVLLDAGHRSIGIIGYPPPVLFKPRQSVTIGQRLAGVKAALQEAGVEPVALVRHTRWEPQHGYDATREVLHSGIEFTALLCMNDRLAFGAYQALQEVGLQIPEDVSIASFDDDEIAAYLRPGLTTAQIPYEEMGRRAMDLLLAAEPTTDYLLVDMPIQLRRSVTPPKRRPR